jgi:hypothetical protein
MLPFGIFNNASYKPQAPLPTEVFGITSTVECKALLGDARDAALQRARDLNDPRSYAFGEAFHVFAIGDKATTRTYSNGNIDLQYLGGCNLLSREDTRLNLWPSSRDKIFKELKMYHDGIGTDRQLSQIGVENATLNCNFSDGKWQCD